MSYTTETNDPAMIKDSVIHFTAFIKKAIEMLAPKDRVILAMIYVERVSQKDVGAFLNLHPGQISRRHDAALTQLRQEVERCLMEYESNHDDQDWFQNITANTKEFSYALVQSLEAAQNCEVA